MSLRFHKSKLVLFGLFLTSSGVVSFTVAQSQKALSTEEVAFTDSEGTSSSSLPDAPGFAADKADAGQRHAQTQIFFMHVAPKYAHVIEPEYQAVPLGAKDKVGYAGRKIFSVQFPIGVLVSAGLSQGIDSEPKYGRDSTAFAKKVGAAGARGASQIIFSDGILAPILHEDPRYYVLGPDHSFSGRLVYAATRVVLTGTTKARTRSTFQPLLVTAVALH